MKEWLIFASENAIVIIDALALAIILFGTAEAFANGLKLIFVSHTGYEKRAAWLRYARWLVVALTFQLAADIIESSITTDWDAVGRIAAIAVIRTFLNCFLERDLEEVRRQQAEDRIPIAAK